ncbi:MAG: stage 0 sporulation family protein [Clostridia bacterium]|nr:stage 0 sporulation family protein [Clostridia bacterium]
MTQVIGVRFSGNGKTYYFDPVDFSLSQGQSVVVETSRGLELGEVALGNHEVEDSEIVQPLKKVIRIATDADLTVAAENREKEKQAMGICQERITAHGLDMSLVDVEYAFDRSKILFYFTADGRVDFRELVKDLAGIFRTRIELRQIGVRDEAKMLGGIGICGRPFCCTTFLDEFHPVSIKMAKDQSLSLNPTKISGSCCRLMCCLKYEQNAYEELSRIMPGVDSIVETPDGRGTVTESVLLKRQIKVRLDSKPNNPPAVYDINDCRIIKKTGARSAPITDTPDN